MEAMTAFQPTLRNRSIDIHQRIASNKSPLDLDATARSWTQVLWIELPREGGPTMLGYLPPPPAHKKCLRSAKPVRKAHEWALSVAIAQQCLKRMRSG
jgi:hypothetical protein